MKLEIASISLAIAILALILICGGLFYYAEVLGSKPYSSAQHINYVMLVESGELESSKEEMLSLVVSSAQLVELIDSQFQQLLAVFRYIAACLLGIIILLAVSLVKRRHGVI